MMRIRKYLYALLLLAFVNPATSQPGTDFMIDHFLSYKIMKVPFQPIQIKASDQFFDQFGISGDFIVRRPTHLLNPTLKVHGGATFDIKDPDTHLISYRLHGTEIDIPGPLLIENQFGPLNIEQGVGPHWILVPAGKEKVASGADAQQPDPDSLVGHFLCYRVELNPDTGFQPFIVEVQDQFRDGKLRKIKVLAPTRLCNPADKMVIASDGTVQTFPRKSPEDHLMCYLVREKGKQVPEAVRTADQFGNLEFKTKRLREICVPSRKHHL